MAVEYGSFLDGLLIEIDSRLFKRRNELVKRALRNTVYTTIKNEVVQYLKVNKTIHTLDVAHSKYIFPRNFVSRTLVLDDVIREYHDTFVVESDYVALKPSDDDFDPLHMIRNSQDLLDVFKSTCTSLVDMMRPSKVWQMTNKEHGFYLDWFMSIGPTLTDQNAFEFKERVKNNFISYLSERFRDKQRSGMLIKEITNIINTIFCFDLRNPADDVISNALVFEFIRNHPDFRVDNEADTANRLVTYCKLLNEEATEPFDYFVYKEQIKNMNSILDPKLSFTDIVTCFAAWKNQDEQYNRAVKPVGCFFQFLINHVENERVNLSKTKRAKVLKRIYGHVKGFISNEILNSKINSVTGEAVLQAIGQEGLIDIKFLVMILRKYQNEFQWIGTSSNVTSITHTSDGQEERRDWTKNGIKSFFKPNLSKYDSMGYDSVQFLSLFVTVDLTFNKFRSSHSRLHESVMSYLYDRKITHYNLLLDIAHDLKPEKFVAFKEHLSSIVVSEVCALMNESGKDQVKFDDVKSLLAGPHQYLISLEEIRAALESSPSFQTTITSATLVQSPDDGVHAGCSSDSRLMRHDDGDRSILPDVIPVQTFVDRFKYVISKAQNDEEFVALEKILLFLNSCEYRELSDVCSNFSHIYDLLCSKLSCQDVDLIRVEIKTEVKHCLSYDTLSIPNLLSKVLRALQKHPVSVFINEKKFSELLSSDDDFVVVTCTDNSPIVSLKRKCLDPYPEWFTELENSILHLVPDDWTAITIEKLFRQLWALNLSREQRYFIFSPVQSHKIHQQYFKRFILQYPCLYSMEGDIIKKKTSSTTEEKSAVFSSNNALSLYQENQENQLAAVRKRTNSPSDSSPPHKKKFVEKQYDQDAVESVMLKVNEMKSDITIFALNQVMLHNKRSLPSLFSDVFTNMLSVKDQAIINSSKTLKQHVRDDVSKTIMTSPYFHYSQSESNLIFEAVCVTRHLVNLTGISEWRVSILLSEMIKQMSSVDDALIVNILLSSGSQPPFPGATDAVNMQVDAMQCQADSSSNAELTNEIIAYLDIVSFFLAYTLSIQ